MTSKCGKNKKEVNETIANCATDVLVAWWSQKCTNLRVVTANICLFLYNTLYSKYITQDRPILRFHVISQWPCSCTGQQRKKSFGNLILLLCKTWATFCHSFLHKHGRLITWVKTKSRWINTNKNVCIVRWGGDTLASDCLVFLGTPAYSSLDDNS